MSDDKKLNVKQRSFMFGAITGIVVVVILGGVFLMGTSVGGGGKVSLFAGGDAKKPTAAQPTQPANPTQPPPPSADVTKIAAVTKDDYILGNANAKVMIIEYSDLECPFCQRFHTTMQQVMNSYDSDEVAWVFRHFPLSFHANAQKEAEASECAGELGGNEAFWAYVDTIFERTTANGTGFALTALRPLAEEIGLNGDEFQECLDSGRMAAEVQKDYQDGLAGGVTGTPGTYVGSTYIPGALPIDQIKAAIDAQL